MDGRWRSQGCPGAARPGDGLHTTCTEQPSSCLHECSISGPRGSTESDGPRQPGTPCRRPPARSPSMTVAPCHAHRAARGPPACRRDPAATPGPSPPCGRPGVPPRRAARGHRAHRRPHREPGNRGDLRAGRHHPRGALPVRRPRDLLHVGDVGRRTCPTSMRPNLVLAAAVLVLAFVARGAFCGWLCPLGFLQDISAGAQRVRPAAPPRRPPRHARAAQGRRPAGSPRPATAAAQVRGARLGPLGHGRVRLHGLP